MSLGCTWPGWTWPYFLAMLTTLPLQPFRGHGCCSFCPWNEINRSIIVDWCCCSCGTVWAVIFLSNPLSLTAILAFRRWNLFICLRFPFISRGFWKWNNVTFNILQTKTHRIWLNNRLKKVFPMVFRSTVFFKCFLNFLLVLPFEPSPSRLHHQVAAFLLHSATSDASRDSWSALQVPLKLKLLEKN